MKIIFFGISYEDCVDSIETKNNSLVKNIVGYNKYGRLHILWHWSLSSKRSANCQSSRGYPDQQFRAINIIFLVM